eukprot:s631_g34.t1
MIQAPTSAPAPRPACRHPTGSNDSHGSQTRRSPLWRLDPQSSGWPQDRMGRKNRGLETQHGTRAMEPAGAGRRSESQICST